MNFEWNGQIRRISNVKIGFYPIPSGEAYDILLETEDGGYAAFIVNMEMCLLAIQSDCYYEHLRSYSIIGSRYRNKVRYTSANYEDDWHLYIKDSIRSPPSSTFCQAEQIEIMHARQFVGHRLHNLPLDFVRGIIVNYEKRNNLDVSSI